MLKKIKVFVFNEQKDLKISAMQVKKIAQLVVEKSGQNWMEVNIHFIDNKAMCHMHEEYFDDPSPTDCISFPMDLIGEDEENEFDDPYRVMGDVFVCPHTAIQWAAENNGDTYEEATLYIVHGMLHLMGYDDIEEQDRLKMREAEAYHMAYLKEQGACLRGVHETL